MTLIIIGMILLIIYLYINAQNNIFDFFGSQNCKNINEIKYNTGDILLFHFNVPSTTKNKLGETMIKPNFDSIIYTYPQYYFHGFYTHAGMVIVRDDNPYVLELTTGKSFNLLNNDYTSNEQSLTKIEDLNYYRGYVSHFRLNKSVEIHQDKIDNLLKYMKNNKIYIEGDVINMIKINGLKMGRHDGRKMSCVDFVCLCMYMLGIIKKYPTFNLGINDMTNILKKYEYEDPIVLKNLHYYTIH